jgi:Undecaprenyl-phosphate glucose phosphotransferase
VAAPVAASDIPLAPAMPAGNAERRQTQRASDKPLTPKARGLLRTAVDKRLSPAVLAGLVRAFDFVLLVATGAIACGLAVVPTWGLSATYIALILGLPAIALFAFQTQRAYELAALRTHIAQGMRLGVTWTMILVASVLIIFFGKLDDHVSRAWLAGWWIGGLSALVVWRFVIARVVRRWTARGRLARRAVIVGGGPVGEALIDALTRDSSAGIEVLGVFDDRADERSPDSVAGYPKLGPVDTLVDFARATPIDLVIVSMPISAEKRIADMLRKLWVLPVDIKLSAHANHVRFRPRSYTWLGSVPVLDVFDRPIADWDVVVKAVFDRVVGGLALLALSPVMLATALAVRLDSKGPALFRQKRYGFNNELIEVYKFRSMYVEKSDAAAARLVTKGDPRVTRVGRFIRKTSLDELPQLFNVVFKGNLSLVGPRPHAVQAKAADQLYGDVVDGYFARHKVKPGITGWAQINGWRGETDTEEKIQRRVEHDLYYIENWSVLFDTYILAMTPVSLVKTENAY